MGKWDGPVYVARWEDVRRQYRAAYPYISRYWKIIDESSHFVKEESRMKQIDFAKPLRVVGEISGPMPEKVTVVKEGVTIVRDEGGFVYVVDEYGVVQPTQQSEGDGVLRLENVPEEPKDHLHLYRLADGGWRIDIRDNQLFTKEYAESLSRSWASHAGAKNTVVVKVPV